MEIGSVNLNAMQQSQSQMNDLALDVKNSTLVNKEQYVQKSSIQKQDQEVTQDLLNAIVNQIPTQIAYEANAGVIRTQDAVQDTLLNIKA